MDLKKILAELQKLTEVASKADNNDAVVKEIRTLTEGLTSAVADDAIKIAVSAEIADKIESGELVEKEASEKAVADAIRPEDVEDAKSGAYIAQLLEAAGIAVQDNDIVAISSKVAAFLDDGLVRLADVAPTRKARILGRLFQRDPRKVQLVLEQGKIFLVVPMKRIIRIPALRKMLERRTGDPETIVNGYGVNNAFTCVVKKHAVYLDEAGIDHTNSPEGYVTLLPEDPCRLAGEIREGIHRHFGADVAVILTDTVTSVGRLGSQDMAVGYAGRGAARVRPGRRGQRRG